MTVARTEIAVDIVVTVHPTIHIVIWFARLLDYLGAEIDIDRVAEFIVKWCMTIRTKRIRPSTDEGR